MTKYQGENSSELFNYIRRLSSWYFLSFFFLDYLLSRIDSLPGVVDELNSKFASYTQDHKGWNYIRFRRIFFLWWFVSYFFSKCRYHSKRKGNSLCFLFFIVSDKGEHSPDFVLCLLSHSQDRIEFFLFFCFNSTLIPTEFSPSHKDKWCLRGALSKFLKMIFWPFSWSPILNSNYKRNMLKSTRLSKKLTSKS